MSLKHSVQDTTFPFKLALVHNKEMFYIDIIILLMQPSLLTMITSSGTEKKKIRFLLYILSTQLSQTPPYMKVSISTKTQLIRENEFLLFLSYSDITQK